MAAWLAASPPGTDWWWRRRWRLTCEADHPDCGAAGKAQSGATVRWRPWTIEAAVWSHTRGGSWAKEQQLPEDETCKRKPSVHSVKHVTGRFQVNVGSLCSFTIKTGAVSQRLQQRVFRTFRGFILWVIEIVYLYWTITNHFPHRVLKTDRQGKYFFSNNRNSSCIGPDWVASCAVTLHIRGCGVSPTQTPHQVGEELANLSRSHMVFEYIANNNVTYYVNITQVNITDTLVLYFSRFFIWWILTFTILF